MNKFNKTCKRCIMDDSASDIIFYEDGTCNYCNDFLKPVGGFGSPKEDIHKLVNMIKAVKQNGKGKRYDCIVGVSGGVDSSWVLVKAVELGLRPLAVHFDNGWNSELAQNNISNLVEILGVDLFTYVIDWNEYRDLQQAFFEANVVDIELLYDNALMEVNLSQARKYKLKYILSGSNTATEGVRMPPGWAKRNKLDFLNIKNIWKAHGKKYRLKSFPGYGFKEYVFDVVIKKKIWVKFLDYMEYDKNEVISILSSKYGYVPYQYKHYESIFTRFYQGYILPKKFNVDKRRNHLSALILSGKLSREEALVDMESPPYGDIEQLNDDMAYFLKKFHWSLEKFNKYIDQPGVSHDIYGSEDYKYELLLKLIQGVKAISTFKGSK